MASAIPHSTGQDTPFSPSWFTRYSSKDANMTYPCMANLCFHCRDLRGPVVHQQELHFVSNSACDTQEEGWFCHLICYNFAQLLPCVHTECVHTLQCLEICMAYQKQSLSCICCTLSDTTTVLSLPCQQSSCPVTDFPDLLPVQT